MALLATAAEILLGLGLLLGYRTRVVATASGLLLITFALTMMVAIDPTAPFDYSVFTAAAGAFVLAEAGKSSAKIEKEAAR